jgi:hypothetical protein
LREISGENRVLATSPAKRGQTLLGLRFLAADIGASAAAPTAVQSTSPVPSSGSPSSTCDQYRSPQICPVRPAHHRSWNSGSRLLIAVRTLYHAPCAKILVFLILYIYGSDPPFYFNRAGKNKQAGASAFTFQLHEASSCLWGVYKGVIVFSMYFKGGQTYSASLRLLPARMPRQKWKRFPLRQLRGVVYLALRETM